MFFAYVGIISGMKDVKRLFEFHGAEHKTINCYEAGMELTVENAKRFGTTHPRCGTSFIVFVLIISTILFSFISIQGWLGRFTLRLLLLPVVAGLSYELIWLGWKFSKNPFIKVLLIPGILTQKITTREPDDGQLEVGIAVLKEAIGE